MTIHLLHVGQLFSSPSDQLLVTCMCLSSEHHEGQGKSLVPPYSCESVGEEETLPRLE